MGTTETGCNWMCTHTASCEATSYVNKWGDGDDDLSPWCQLIAGNNHPVTVAEGRTVVVLLVVTLLRRIAILANLTKGTKRRHHQTTTQAQLQVQRPAQAQLRIQAGPASSSVSASAQARLHCKKCTRLTLARSAKLRSQLCFNI